MREDDWQGAAWLVALPHTQVERPKSDTQYRHTFSIPHPENIEFARVYVAAAGCAHVEVNGAVPLPDMRGICPWVVKGTSMRSIRYMTHRIGADHDEDGYSSGVTLGKTNVIGVISGNVSLADRHWTPPGQQLLLLLMIKFVGEAQPFFLSSASRGWQSTSSYVVSNSAWDTTIDWRKHEHGWSTPEFKPDPERWLPAAAPIPANSTHAVSARALAMPVSTVLEEVAPDSVRHLENGDYLYHFPKNFVGTLRVKTVGAAEANASLIVLLGEWLSPRRPNALSLLSSPQLEPPTNDTGPPGPWGTPGGYPVISGPTPQFENHVLRAESSQSLETMFCWHGFQFVRVISNGTTGFAGRLHDIVGLAIHTNMTATGKLTFDDSPAGQVLAGVNEMTLQSQRTNVAAYIPTDCP
jgi:hypothetical protein